MSEPHEYIRYFFSIPNDKTIYEHLPRGIGFEVICDLMRGYVSKKDKEIAKLKRQLVTKKKEHILDGDDIKIEEMPQGCFISHKTSEITIRITSPKDAKIIINSLNRYLDFTETGKPS